MSLLRLNVYLANAGLCSRRAADKLINNGEIKLSVLEVRGNQVRIGIDAPKHVIVHREEIFNRIQKEATAEVAE